jgi:uncharacterized membrane protein YtjA (UPF0391 family)
MLEWPILFLTAAILAAILGFGGILFAAAGLAKLFFYVFLLVFLVSLLFNLAHHA